MNKNTVRWEEPFCGEGNSCLGGGRGHPTRKQSGGAAGPDPALTHRHPATAPPPPFTDQRRDPWTHRSMDLRPHRGTAPRP